MYEWRDQRYRGYAVYLAETPVDEPVESPLSCRPPARLASETHAAYPCPNRPIDLIQEPLPTLRSLVPLDCSLDWSDRSRMVAILLITVCPAAGLAVHAGTNGPRCLRFRLR